MTADDADRPASAEHPPLARDLLGYVWVDTGHLVVTDPNYAQELDPEAAQQATTQRARAAMIGEGLAAAFRVGIRNGRYPVYVTRYPNGAIAKFEVELDERFQQAEPNKTEG